MILCDSFMEFYQFSPQFVFSLVTTKKLSTDVESPHFLTFSAKHHKFKIGEKYFVKSVGTLNYRSNQSPKLVNQKSRKLGVLG